MNIRLAAAVAVSLPCATFAQAPAPVQALPALSATPIVAVPVASGNVLPANTEIWLAANQEVNSKRYKQGQSFDMSVARDVVLGNYIVIPRGTPARGQIGYRTGKGAFGKSAKMEFDLTEIVLPGRTIPVTGHYRIEGQGNTGAAVGAAVAVGVFGAFVTGHSAVVPQGQEYRAFTREQLAVAIAPVAPATSLAATPAAVTPVVPATTAPAVLVSATGTK